MKVRVVAFVIWAAVAASAMFWILRLGAVSPAAPAHTQAVAAAAAPRGDLSRLFGAAAVSPATAAAVAAESPASSRFRLLGVAAPRQGGDRVGLALIAVDGKPARSYTVGSAVDGELVLQLVHARGARLGVPGAPPQVTLEIPALPPPATGNLPQAQAPASPAAMPGARIGTSTPPLSQSPATAVQTEPQQVEPIPVLPPSQAGGSQIQPHTR